MVQMYNPLLKFHKTMKVKIYSRSLDGHILDLFGKVQGLFKNRFRMPVEAGGVDRASSSDALSSRFEPRCCSALLNLDSVRLGILCYLEARLPLTSNSDLGSSWVDEKCF